MTEKQETAVKCPFFEGSWKNTIQCESMIGSAAMLTRFSDGTALKTHVKRFCSKEDGGTCPLAMNLYDKYRRLESLERERAKERKLRDLKY